MSICWDRCLENISFAVLDFVVLKVFVMWTKVGLGNMAQNVFGFSFSAQYSVLGIRLLMTHMTHTALESSCRRGSGTIMFAASEQFLIFALQSA